METKNENTVSEVDKPSEQPRKISRSAVGVIDVNRSSRGSFVRSLDLKDQNDKRLEIESGVSSYVFVVGDRKSAKATRQWGDELERALPSRCRVIRLLDLQDLPHAAAPFVKRAIRKQIGKKRVQVFLDWKGEVARRYRIPVGVPMIVCLDEHATRLDTVKGPMKAESLKRVIRLYNRPPMQWDQKS